MQVSDESFFVYIMTNTRRTVLYVGVTNSLEHRVVEHYLNRGQSKSFAGRYHCYWLIYFEGYKYINDAIAREKEIKKWSRDKKHKLVETINPKWESLNAELFGEWPPKELFHRNDS